MDKKSALKIMWRERQETLAKLANLEVMIIEAAGWKRSRTSADFWKRDGVNYLHERESAIELIRKEWEL